MSSALPAEEAYRFGRPQLILSSCSMETWPCPCLSKAFESQRCFARDVGSKLAKRLWNAQKLGCQGMCSVSVGADGMYGMVFIMV